MASVNKGHPQDPPSNIAKVGSYDPDKYRINMMSLTVRTNECLEPNRPPRLTQDSIGLYLVPTTYELNENPPRPTTAELEDAVIDRMVVRDKAFWVDKPGSNAYILHDAYYRYGMTTEKILPTAEVSSATYFQQDLSQEAMCRYTVFSKSIAPQAVFPRSYQYELDCVKYRRLHACDGLHGPAGPQRKPVGNHCRDCTKLHIPGMTPFQLAWAQSAVQKRWKYYPDASSKMTNEQIRKGMIEHGRPYRHEACTWYNENYPSIKHDLILRKFSK